MTDKVTYEEQEEQGLLRRRIDQYGRYVPSLPQAQPKAAEPIQGEIVDPYPGNVGTAAKATIVFTSDPITRAKALLIETAFSGAIMGLMTGFAMWALQLYPRTLTTFAIFLLWMFIMFSEWMLMFAYISWLKWHEHPSSIAHKEANTARELMRTEQRARLISVYKLTDEEFDKVVKK